VEGGHLRQAWIKGQLDHIPTKQPGMVASTYNPGDAQSVNKRIVGFCPDQADLDKKTPDPA
jgi:hypothetical protein